MTDKNGEIVFQPHRRHWLTGEQEEEEETMSYSGSFRQSPTVSSIIRRARPSRKICMGASPVHLRHFQSNIVQAITK